jgi:hypothetical protein
MIPDNNLLKIRDIEKRNTIKHKDLIDLDFTLKFKQTKLTTRDYIYMLLGALFLGPSIMVLHIVGMLAMQIEGIINFYHHMQIPITIVGIIASLVINIAFYGPNTNKIKVFLSILITGTVMALHCLSIMYTDFLYDNTQDYSFISTDGNLIRLELGGKIIVGIASSLAYMFREMINSKIRKSLRIVHDISDYVKDDEFNYSYVKKYLEFLKINKSKEEEKKAEVSIPSRVKLIFDKNVIKTDLLNINK